MSDSRMVCKVGREGLTLLRQRGGRRVSRSTIAVAKTSLDGLEQAVKDIYPIGLDRA